MAALPGSFHAQYPCPRSEGLQPDGGGDHLHDLRTARGNENSCGPSLGTLRCRPALILRLRFLDAAREYLLAFTEFPSAHWQQIWSTNPLERLNKEIKRRTNVVGTFPNPAALLRLTGQVLIEQHDEWDAAERRYFSENSMKLVAQPVEGRGRIEAA